MRLSIDGENVLGQVQGAWLNGALLLSSGSGWDFLTGGCTGWGGFNGPPNQIGIYQSPLVNPQATFQPTNLLTPLWTVQTGLWTDGQSRTLINCTTGAYDSDGNRWPTYAALGSSRQGDWLFVDTSSYTTLVVRSASGVETIYPFGQYFVLGGMDNGVVLYQLNSGQIQATGGVTPPVIPTVAPFVTDPKGHRWIGGYQSGFGLCLARWDLAPAGWLLSSDGRDYNPAIAWRARDGQIVVASGQNAGETVTRLYVINPTTMTCTRNGAPWPLQAVNLMQAPPVPPDPPVPPIPPDPPIPPLPPDPFTDATPIVALLQRSV